MSALAVDPSIQVMLRSVLALLFAASAVHKLRDVERFRAAVEGYDLLPPLWNVPVAAALIALELGIAVAFCLADVAAAAGIAAAGLLLLYAGAIGANLRRGRRDIDCGCGGLAGRQTISEALLARNVALAGLALASTLPVGGRSLTWVDGATIVAGVVTVALLSVAVDGLVRNARTQRSAGVRSELADA